MYVYKKIIINVRACTRGGQVEATALTSPRASILTLLLLRYWIQLPLEEQRPADLQRFYMWFYQLISVNVATAGLGY